MGLTGKAANLPPEQGVSVNPGSIPGGSITFYT